MEGYNSLDHGGQITGVTRGYAFNYIVSDRTMPNAPASAPYKHVNPKQSCDACKDVNTRITRRVARPWYSSAEIKRTKRVVKYKYYAVEGKVKSSIRKGFKWIKKKCSKIVRGPV